MKKTIESILAVILLILLLCIVLLSESAFGDSINRIEISSSPNPVGSGARALGMGGAFIAVADDATAASWNPGGLIQLERPEISAVGAFFHRIEDNDFGSHPESSGKQPVSKTDVNYLSAAYPFVLFDRNMIVSLNFQHLYDFTRKWNFPLNTVSSKAQYNVTQKGGLSALGLAYSIQIKPTLSLGATFNIWNDKLYDNGWEQKTIATESGTTQHTGIKYSDEYFKDDTYHFRGYNANLGLMWQPTGKLTVGAVFKTPFTASLRHSSTVTTSNHFPDAPSNDQQISNSSESSEKLLMPMSYGLGGAYRFSDNLTIALDVYRTEWEDFVQVDSKGNRTSPLTGLSVDESHIKPITQLRLGGEYLFIGQNHIIPIRAGLFYDPAPTNGGFDKYYGLTLGTGIGINGVIFDAAYQYRFGNGVGGAIVQGMDFKQDVREHTIYASMIVHF